MAEERYSASDVAKINCMEIEKMKESLTPEQAHKLVLEALDAQLKMLQDGAAPRLTLAITQPMCW